MTEAELQAEFGATIEVPDDEGLRALREAGEIWRLRDRLCCNIGLVYNRENLENCGRVLLEMGEGHRAGVHLFWSGARDERYQQAIDLFLEKPRSHAKMRRMLALNMDVTLPAHAADLPASVLMELEEQGVVWDEMKPGAHEKLSMKQRLGNVLFFLGCGLFIIGGATCLVVGAYAIWQFLLGN